MANQVKTTFTGDAKPLDREVAKAQANIRRYQQQRERDEQRLTQLLERQAEQRARAEIRAVQRTQREIARIRREGQRALTATGGIGPGGIAGAAGFLGGAVAIGSAVAALRQLASAVGDVSVASVRLASDYQQTINAMTVFTGSAGAAREELAQLKALSQRTPGLRLADAEAGARSLRALGFEAQIVNDLVGGLAKQRILSGAGSDAIGRVTFNLAQLATGGGDFQDVRELLTNLPTLRKVLVETFGSLEQFQRQIRDNPTQTLQAFATALNQVQAPAAGLQDATDKLKDSLISLGRSAGEPLLDPLTRDVKDLTALMNESSEAARNLGIATSNIYRGGSALVQGSGIGAAARLSSSDAASGNAFQLGGFQLLGIAGGPLTGAITSAIISLERFGEALKTADERLRERFPNFDNSRFDFNTFTVNSGGPAALTSRNVGRITNGELSAELQRRFDIEKAFAALEKDKRDKQYAAEKKAAEETKKRLEEIRRAKESIFDAAISDTDNPFLRFLGNANREMRNLLETANVLSPAIRNAFAANARESQRVGLFGLRLDAQLDAQSLRRQAAEFRQGYRNDLSDPVTVQRIVDQQLRLLRGNTSPFIDINDPRISGEAFNGEFRFLQARNAALDPRTQAVTDQRLLNLAGSLDPAALREDQRNSIASAFEREAARRLDAEREASDFYQSMASVISGEKSLNVKVAEGSHLVTIKNESDLARVERRATAAETSARYGN